MDKPTSDFNPIETMMMQRVAFFAIMRCLDIGLFDTLEAFGGLSASGVAEAHGLDTARAEGLLDMLAAADVLENKDGTYANTLLASEHLVSTSPFFQGKALALHVRFNEKVEAGFDDLLRGLEDSRKFSDDGWGVEDVMRGTAQHARMGALQDTTAFVASLPGFGGMRRMCDIGGNHGDFSMALLDRNPGLSGEIADLPHVVSTANERIGRKGYGDRLEAVARDLRTETLPEGAYDLVLASHVLYGFMRTLPGVLAGIHASLRPGGWFVSHHQNPESAQSSRYSSVVEFITRMAGYDTHHIDGGWLSDQLKAAGFSRIETATAGMTASGLLVAARKD